MEQVFISLRDGTEKNNFNEVTDSHYTSFTDNVKNCIIVLTGNRYVLTKYLEDKKQQSPILLTRKSTPHFINK